MRTTGLNAYFTNTYQTECPITTYKVRFLDTSDNTEKYYLGTDVTTAGSDLLVSTAAPISGIIFIIEASTNSNIKDTQ